MRFLNERVLRKAATENWDIIVTEYECNGKTYCRTHIDFQDSNSIKDRTFEELCVQYGVSEDNCTKMIKGDNIRFLPTVEVQEWNNRGYVVCQ